MVKKNDTCLDFTSSVNNPVNNNGLSNIVPAAIVEWYHCEHEIYKLKKEQEECLDTIDNEYISAKKAGYTQKEIKQLVGNITIPSWYFIKK